MEIIACFPILCVSGTQIFIIVHRYLPDTSSFSSWRGDRGAFLQTASIYCIRVSSIWLRHEPLATVRPRMGNNTVRLPPKVLRTSCPTEPGNGCLWTRGTTEIIASCICNIGSLIESANAQYWQTVNFVRKYRCFGCSEIMVGYAIISYTLITVLGRLVITEGIGVWQCVLGMS